MKKQLLSILSVAFLSGSLWAQEGTTPAPTEVSAPAEVSVPAVSPLQNGLGQLSSVQSMLEFFFMEAGVYPAELSELNTAFNFQLPKGAKPVVVPKDPATGLPFIYIAAPNKKGYRLRFPDPSQYGLDSSFELGPVSWGWLALRADRIRFEEMAKLSKHHMNNLATALEMYAKDNKNAYPATLDLLYPNFIKRHPQDPITGKNYIYKPLADGYLISSPNPERYGLRIFQYSSSRGMIVESLTPSAPSVSGTAKPVPAPKP